MMRGPAGAAAAADAEVPQASSSSSSRQQKAALLWGAKRDAAAAGVAPALGANHWECASFGDRRQQIKFHRLMGAQQQHSQQPQPAQRQQQQPAGPAGGPGKALTREQQAKVLHDVEAQFTAGLRRADGRTLGLGR